MFHVMNRAARGATLFGSSHDYVTFLEVLCEACARRPMRLLSFTGMKTHWHMVLWPAGDDDLPRFMHWFSTTQVGRWHAAHGTSGTGTLYQGRYKAIPVQTDSHFFRVMAYVERNPVRAGLVERAEEWPWSSASLNPGGPRPPLAQWPVARPSDWISLLANEERQRDLAWMRRCIRQDVPYGSRRWRFETATSLGWDASLRKPGRPPRNSLRVKEIVQSLAF